MQSVQHRNQKAFNRAWSHGVNLIHPETGGLCDPDNLSLQCDSITVSIVVCVLCSCVRMFLHLLTELQHSPLEKSSGVLFQEGAMLWPQREPEAVQGQSRCIASAAQSDRPNEAICDGNLCPQPWLCYHLPSKLAAAGLRPAHQCTLSLVSFGCWTKKSH